MYTPIESALKGLLFRETKSSVPSPGLLTRGLMSLIWFESRSRQVRVVRPESGDMLLIWFELEIQPCQAGEAGK